MNRVQLKQTEIGEIPEGWECAVLSDMAEIIKDGYKPTGNDDLVYIGLEHIDQQLLSLNSIGHSTEVESNKFVFQSGDILFGKLRPYFRKVYRPRFNGVCSTDIWVVRAKKDIDQGFLFYFMANRDFVDLASLGSSGTRMPRADWRHLKDTSWKKPPINEQRTIAKILSALDEKIGLNHQMNKTLESIAQAIFKRWFVDFEFQGHEKAKLVDSLPKGWRHGALGEIITIESGKRPGEKSVTKTQDFTVPLIGASSVMGFVKSALYNEPILIIGRVGTHGIVQRVSWSSFPSDNTLVIRSKHFEFIYQILKTIDYEALNVGTTQPLITQTAINKYGIVIPSDEVLEQFETYISGLFKKVVANNQESESLVEIRDSLLPRLMSGKLSIL